MCKTVGEIIQVMNEAKLHSCVKQKSFCYQGQQGERGQKGEPGLPATGLRGLKVRLFLTAS